MILGNDETKERLAAHDHGVLCTVHVSRGSDPVPVVYALDGDRLGIPIDQVKSKSSTRLQRERNLEADPRATLLIDHWDRHDWSQLWWIRAELQWLPDANDAQHDSLADLLAGRYPQYEERPFHRILVFTVTKLSGWAATS